MKPVYPPKFTEVENSKGEKLWKAEVEYSTYYRSTREKAEQAVENHKPMTSEGEKGAEAYYGQGRYNGD